MPEHLLELTADTWRHDAREFAAARGLQVLDVELDRAFHAHHVVVRETTNGTVEDAAARLAGLAGELSRATYGEGSHRHFTTAPPKGRGDWEHRVGVLLPDESVTTVLRLTDIAARHGARMWRETGSRLPLHLPARPRGRTSRGLRPRPEAVPERLPPR